MADKNLLEVDRNPGQERYHDLFDNRASIRDAEDMAANGYEQDYSQAKDYSAGNSKNNDSYLKNRENSFANSQDNADFTDIRQRERQASKSDFETTGFDKDHSKDQARRQRMNGFKNKALGGAFGLLACGGVSFGLFTVISGPMQLVQAAEVIQDFKLGIVTAQQAARSWRTTRSITKLAGGSTLTDTVERSRLGVMAKKQADAMVGRLSDRGVEFSTNTGGYSKGGFRVDVSKQLGIDNPSDADIENLAKKMGIGDKFEVSEITETLPDGTTRNVKVLDVSDNLNYSETRKAISALDDPGMSKVKSYLQTRATMKKLGYTSWLHPIEKAKTAASKKAWDLVDFIDDQISKKLMKADNTDTRIRDGANEDNEKGVTEEVTDADGNTQTVDVTVDADESIEIMDGATDEIKNIREGKPKRGVIRGSISNIDDFLGKFAGTAGILAIVGVICMIQGIIESAGPYKQMNIINVAEKGSSLIMGYGSQVKSGTDIDLEQTKLAVEMTMGADVDQLEADGSATGKTEYSSFWAATPVCAELGTANCSGDESLVPDSLRTAGAATLFGEGPIADFFYGLLNGGGLLEAGLKLVCKLVDLAGSILGGVTDLITGFLIDLLLEKTGILNGFMSWLMGLLFGNPLDLTSIVPEQWGSVAMYGGHFTSNDQALGIGGKQLNSTEAMELNIENRRYLAWKNSQKPLLAKLVDPSDYNSSVNQIARAAQLNTSNQSFSTQLANVFKVFTSAPTVIATASNQLIGGSAYAASAYDYGVDTWAYNIDEMDLALSSDNYDLLTNTEDVLTALKAEEDGGISTSNFDSDPYRTYAYNCLGVEIESVDSGGKVKLADNQDGTVWNYIDNTPEHNKDVAYCESAASDMLGLRLYIQDYFNVISSACYEGDADDGDSTSACQEVGIDTGMSGSSTTAINTAGNQDPEVWQQSFVEETGNGTYGDYDTRSNGCTTISAWFVGAHTDLTYGHGNGKDVVDQLIAANPGAGLEATSTPTKAPSLFSAWEPSTMTSSAEYGHVGLVTAIDPDGTIHTLESGSGAGKKGKPWSFTNTYTKEDYASNAKFVYLGDHLK